MKPILFNTEMVRAILDGRKSVTRRVVQPKHLRVLDSPYHKEHPETPEKVLLERLCEPPYRPGDILYVREAWWSLLGHYIYRADQKPGIKNPGKWHPSIHMPKEAARLFLRVTGVRVERLQKITPAQLRAEGVKIFLLPSECQNMFNRFGAVSDFLEKKKEFAGIWDSTIKKADLPLYGWAANPWVWVIEFERCERPQETHSARQVQVDRRK